MYNILILSEKTEVFDNLIALLKADSFQVYDSTCKKINESFFDLKIFDFILLHLEEDDRLNEANIKMIKNLALCPMYLFSKGHTPHRVSQFLEIGSEGHIDIPFHPEVVFARMKAVLRYVHQIKNNTPDVFKCGRLEFHIDNREVYMDGRLIHLTSVEFKILQILLEYRDSAVSKDKIIHYVWDEDKSATDNALGIHITRLRKKLKQTDEVDIIDTVWGLGYRLNLSGCL